ncbi:hypothetical protein [Aureivirga sp. CE67]|uniref:hypothetical protein n=1 Tax=Aureivirga sp. CE67 TaxID=1788983 RepID=UPI0018CB4B95|nr:hypothetical protein [Aureivirga sp. CE67]
MKKIALLLLLLNCTINFAQNKTYTDKDIVFTIKNQEISFDQLKIKDLKNYLGGCKGIIHNNYDDGFIFIYNDSTIDWTSITYGNDIFFTVPSCSENFSLDEIPQNEDKIHIISFSLQHYGTKLKFKGREFKMFQKVDRKELESFFGQKFKGDTIIIFHESYDSTAFAIRLSSRNTIEEIAIYTS